MSPRLRSLRVALLSASLALFSCGAPFHLAAERTNDFPRTWEETLQPSSASSSPSPPDPKRPTPPPKASRPSPTSKGSSKSTSLISSVSSLGSSVGSSVSSSLNAVLSPSKTPSPSRSAPAPLSASPQAEEGRLERVAVLELKNMIKGQVTQEEVGFLTSELRSILSQLPPERFVVMTRESMAVMIDPSVRLEDCVGTCEVDTGRILGAEWIITGEVVRFGSSLRVSLKLHNTHTGQLLYGSSAKGKGIEDLEQPIQIEGLRLMGEVSPFVKRRLAELAGDDPAAQLKALREGALRAP